MTLVGHWKLDEESGSTAVATVGSNGTYVNSPTLRAVGPGGSIPYGVEFTPTESGLVFPVSVTAYPVVVACWVYYPANASNIMFGSLTVDGESTVYFGIGRQFVSGWTTSDISIERRNTSLTTTIVGTQVFGASTSWRHLAVVYSSDTSYEVYLNGVQVDATTGATSVEFPFSTINRLIAPQFRTTSTFTWTSGRMADLRLYDAATGWGATEADAIYQLGVLSAPSITTTSPVSVAEGTAAVATMAATGTTPFTWTITGGADAARFSINSSTGALAFVTPPDYENPTDADTNNAYVVQVTATNAGGSDALDLTVNVTDVAGPVNTVAPVISKVV